MIHIANIATYLLFVGMMVEAAVVLFALKGVLTSFGK